MNGWILAIFIHAGVFADTDSVTVTTAVYSSQQSCETAGKINAKLVSGTKKSYAYTCTKQ